MSTDQAAPQPKRPSGRELAIALLAGLVAGGLLVYAAGRPWQHLGSTGVTGRQLDDIPYALGLVGLAGTIAVLAAGRILRPVVGVLLALAGVGAAVSSVLAPRRAFSVSVISYSGAPPVLSATAWPLVSLAAGVLLAVVGVAVVLRGNNWPGMGRRYDAPGSDPDPRPQDPDLAAWAALDRGEDPTRKAADPVAQPDEHGPAARHPDPRPSADRDV